MAEYNVVFSIDLKMETEVDSEDDKVDKEKLELIKENPEEYAREQAERIVEILETQSLDGEEYFINDSDAELVEK